MRNRADDKGGWVFSEHVLFISWLFTVLYDDSNFDIWLSVFMIDAVGLRVCKR